MAGLSQRERLHSMESPASPRTPCGPVAPNTVTVTPGPNQDLNQLTPDARGTRRRADNERCPDGNPSSCPRTPWADKHTSDAKRAAGANVRLEFGSPRGKRKGVADLDVDGTGMVDFVYQVSGFEDDDRFGALAKVAWSALMLFVLGMFISHGPYLFSEEGIAVSHGVDSDARFPFPHGAF